MQLGMPPGMPGMPPVPGMPQGMPPQSVPQQSPQAHQGGAQSAAQRARMIQQQAYQQAAIEYEAEKHSGILPEIVEFAEHFQLDDRCTRALDDVMKQRKSTFEQDLEA